MASEYGWTITEIENLTYFRINNFLKVIQKRKEQEEYYQRVHIGIQAMAIVNALGAAFDKKEINMDDLVGKAPWQEVVDNANIEEWKENAKQKGLKTNDA